jgi:hypothetical protein
MTCTLNYKGYLLRVNARLHMLISNHIVLLLGFQILSLQLRIPFHDWGRLSRRSQCLHLVS